MSRDHTIRTTLERLDHKPVLWKGLTIDELLFVVTGNLFVICIASSIVLKITFGKGILGFVFGIILSLLAIPYTAGYIEKAKKQHGGQMMWLHFKKFIQKKGWWKFDGLMTEKRLWDTRFSKIKPIQYLGPK